MLQVNTQGAKMVQIAESQLGLKEDSRGENKGPEIKKYFEVAGVGEGLEWCNFFVNWVYKQTTGKFAPWGKDMGFVPELVRWAKQNGRWVRHHDPKDKHFALAEPQVGDLLIVGDFHPDFLPKMQHYKHVGIVAEVHSHKVETIDGNVGNMVSRNHRSRAFDGHSDYIAGYVRLFDSLAPIANPPIQSRLVAMAQHRLIVHLDQLTADSELVSEIQTRLMELGLLNPPDVDGIIGPRTLGALARFCDFAHLDNMATRKFGPTFATKLLETRLVPQDFSMGVNLVAPATNESKFDTALRFVLKWEGGFVNHPADPGGATNKGITQRTYDAYRLQKSLPTRSVQFLADDEMRDIYSNRYWKPSQAELMVTPLALAHFDSCVNFGIGGGTTFLQEALGLPMDGDLGSQTRQAMLARNNRELALEIVEKRIAYRHERVRRNPSQEVFLKGWLNRDNDLRRLILSL